MESNVQKISEAARHLLCVIEEMGLKPWCADSPLAIACDKLDAALALPLHNCDIGTEEEQAKRYQEFCDESQMDEDYCSMCARCSLKKEKNCVITWTQMQYESEVKQ